MCDAQINKIRALENESAELKESIATLDKRNESDKVGYIFVSE